MSSPFDAMAFGADQLCRANFAEEVTYLDGESSKQVSALIHLYDVEIENLSHAMISTEHLVVDLNVKDSLVHPKVGHRLKMDGVQYKVVDVKPEQLGSVKLLVMRDSHHA